LLNYKAIIEGSLFPNNKNERFRYYTIFVNNFSNKSENTVETL
jgi:hypothetical protein